MSITHAAASQAFLAHCLDPSLPSASLPPEVLHPDTMHVPRGWDSVPKICMLNDQFARLPGVKETIDCVAARKANSPKAPGMPNDQFARLPGVKETIDCVAAHKANSAAPNAARGISGDQWLLLSEAYQSLFPATVEPDSRGELVQPETEQEFLAKLAAALPAPSVKSTSSTAKSALDAKLLERKEASVTSDRDIAAKLQQLRVRAIAFFTGAILQMESFSHEPYLTN